MLFFAANLAMVISHPFPHSSFGCEERDVSVFARRRRIRPPAISSSVNGAES